MGVLLALVVPSFSRVREQNQVDGAAQYLRSIWCAERVYWLENRTFADDLSLLDALGLIDPKVAGGNDGYFDYTISAATASTFTATATRNGSGVWNGTLTITEDGDVTGNVNNGSVVLLPPGI
jgi:Tfp pilus assembly protein PilE